MHRTIIAHGMADALVLDGRVYGPAEAPAGVTLLLARGTTTASEVAMMRAAGYTIDLRAYCTLCSEPLADPEDWSITRHVDCAAHESHSDGGA